MSLTDDLLANSAAHAAAFDRNRVPLPHRPKVAVVACMDARLDVYGILGLEPGQAHVIRNAGGIVTGDVIRSLAISQCVLGSEEVILIHHTGCGMTTPDSALRRRIQEEAGIEPPFPLEAFTDLDENVRASIARLQASPFVPRCSNVGVRGFVYDVDTGDLREVEARG